MSDEGLVAELRRKRLRPKNLAGPRRLWFDRWAMTELDLFVMARENAEHLALECADHTGAVVELAASVTQHGRLSVTMRFERLRTFLEGGRYLNPWEECALEAKGDEAETTRLMVKQQKEYYLKRVLFEGRFVGGRKFCYGALYTGGRALVDTKYGPFSAVFRLDAARAWELIAWLPGNSLARYVPDDTTFNAEQLTCEVGAHGSRHHVAAIKHANEVENRSREEWPIMLCHGDCFIEGIVAEDLVPSEVESMLVDTALWKTLQDAADAVLDGDDADAQEQADASRFTELRGGLTKWKLLEEMV